MEFGIFDHFEHRGGDLSTLYADRLRMLEFADRAGFARYHKAEHHFTVLDAAPRGLMFLAAAAQRTERLRLGTLGTLLPFQQPLRLLEDVCMLDHLSNGRFDLGIGKGVSPVEHEIDGRRADDASSITTEVVTILRRGLATGVVNHHGEHFRFANVPLGLQPKQRPYPPLWYPGNVEFAGLHRLNTVVGGPVPVVAEQRARFEACLARGEDDWNPGASAPIFGVTQHVFVARDGVAARERSMRAWKRYDDNLTSLWRARGVPLAGSPTLGGNAELALQVGALVAGTPAEVLARAHALRDVAGVHYFVGAFAWGDVAHDETMSSLELLAREVMPALGG